MNENGGVGQRRTRKRERERTGGGTVKLIRNGNDSKTKL